MKLPNDLHEIQTVVFYTANATTFKYFPIQPVQHIVSYQLSAPIFNAFCQPPIHIKYRLILRYFVFRVIHFILLHVYVIYNAYYTFTQIYCEHLYRSAFKTIRTINKQLLLFILFSWADK